FLWLGFRTATGSVQRSREKGGERTLRAQCAGVAVQRFAPEPCGSLTFQRRVRVRRTFDRVEMAEGMGLISNLLWKTCLLTGRPFSWAIQLPCRPTSRAQGDGIEAVSLP